MKSFILFSMLASGWAHAQPAWVKTPFWQTAYNKNLSVKIKGDSALSDICEEYSLLVADGSKLSAREVDAIRTNTDQIHDSQFSSIFTIDRIASERSISQSLRETALDVSQAATQDVIPRFSQSAASISPLEKIYGMQIVFGADSLSRISQSLGLRPLRIEIASYTPEIKIKVYGRDSACDLFSGKASLTAASTGAVKIALDEQLLLNEFYQAIEDATETSFKRTQSPIARMAVLGYNLGPALAPLRLSNDKALNVVENLVASFFDARGERNDVWSIFNGKPHLSVNGSASVQFQLRMER